MPDHPRAYVSALRLQLPTNRRQLAAWVDTFLGMHLPDQPQCPDHTPPSITSSTASSNTPMAPPTPSSGHAAAAAKP